MKIELLAEMIIEILVAARALQIIRNGHIGWKKYVAAATLVIGVFGAAVDLIRILAPGLVLEMHSTQVIFLYFIVYLYLARSARLEVDQDDAQVILNRMLAGLNNLNSLTDKMESHHGLGQAKK